MFSQNEEEKYILEYFGDKIGTFISIGENDGITFSNVRALALRGWKGICIDPSPTAFPKLKELYKDHKGIRCYDYAISKHNGKDIFHDSGALCSASDTGLVGTFHAKEMDRFKATVKYSPVEVKTFKWKTALNRWQIKEFDFFSIDCEGDELTFMGDIDFSKTSCVCVEWNGRNDLKAEYDKILKDFRVIYTSAENLIYAR